MRHNWEKYQKRRSIRNEWKKRLSESHGVQYGRVVTEYQIVTNKIRRYYDWLFMFTGRRC